MTIRKIHTGEPTPNGGHFGSKRLNEPSSLTLGSADEPDVLEERVTEHFVVQVRSDDSLGEAGWVTKATYKTPSEAYGDLRFRFETRVRPMIRTEQILDERVSDSEPFIPSTLSPAGQWDAFRKFARDGHGMTSSEVRHTFDIGAVLAENTETGQWGNVNVTSSSADILASLESHRWEWDETYQNLCHDRGPRIGGHEDTPRCRLVKDHQSKSHTTHPENDGWDYTW